MAVALAPVVLAPELVPLLGAGTASLFGADGGGCFVFGRTIFIMAVTTFSHYLGHNYYKKSKKY